MLVEECVSTTVEILSTSKGGIHLLSVGKSTTVEILSTSKGSAELYRMPDLQQ